MIVLKTIRSLYTFYQSHFFVGVCISLSCLWMYSELGDHTIPILCWYKAITEAIFVYAVNKRKHKEFFYYQNLGLSKTFLWSITLSIDFLLFAFFMSLGNQAA